ncbi:c-type cytochrome [Bradyrhizobium sp. AUGA SZCCT0283]|jgi:mono/diheme cytochrome c family protein|uniref:c-type cytochrome n=1 Tax=Bradyrhizobium sp. AUGA SZCCT0283 TaxID=2807671 RepID=UPI001BAD7136|nr:c-type cytochrome [Bradyrhizobium sp. AUGA SZCCT0283]MBR1276649.1 cytochrome c [Bradyrhizobium sp. AUGA SZCCT0283]
MPGFASRPLLALACLALPLLGVGPSAAQALDPEQQRAKAMLENLCGRCHAVGKTGQSPNPLAPAFRRFGEKLYDTDMVQRLQDGLTTIHPDMPTFRFNRHEAAAAVNYLRSIQKSR